MPRGLGPNRLAKSRRVIPTTKTAPWLITADSIAMMFHRGCIPCPEHVRRAKLGVEHSPSVSAKLRGTLVGQADLTSFDPPRKDQGPTASCTAHATVGALQNARAFAKVPLPFDPSEDQAYKASRAFERGQGAGFGRQLLALTDSGCSLSSVSEAIRIFGMAPFTQRAKDGRNSDVDPSWVNDEPDVMSLIQAHANLVTGEYRIEPSQTDAIDLLAACIEAGHPVVTGFFADSTFESLAPDQVAEAPNESDPNGGGHAIYLVKYVTQSDGSRLFTLTNSWGNWCRDGRCDVSEAWLRRAWDFYPMIWR